MSSKAFVSRGSVLAAALFGVGLSVAPASAQGWYGRGPAFFEEAAPVLPPRAVVYRLHDRGFTEITRPLFDGRGYRLEATDPAGRRVRLFVDAGDGAVIGRQRLDPYFPSDRPVRTAPGYGWTEDESGPRGRAAERLIPPADIPDAGPYRAPRPSAAAPRPPRLETPPSADANALGLNPDARGPDARGRAEAPPRRTARLTSPAKPVAPRASPVAPAPKLSAPDDAARENAAKAAPDATPSAKERSSGENAARANPANAAPDAAATPGADAKPAPAVQTAPVAEPAVAAVAPAREPEPVRAAEPAAPKPAAVQSPAAETAAQAPKTASAAPNWQNPPPEPARKVRVIGGATVVPRGEVAPQGGN